MIFGMFGRNKKYLGNVENYGKLENIGFQGGRKLKLKVNN